MTAPGVEQKVIFPQVVLSASSERYVGRYINRWVHR